MITELNKEQQKAFNRLKKAYSDCRKLNIEIYNLYGTIEAYNGNLILGLGDDEIKPKGIPVYYRDVMNVYGGNSNKIDNIDPGRADDESIWMLGLSDEAYRNYENDI